MRGGCVYIMSNINRIAFYNGRLDKEDAEINSA
jgi:hypothetical protein